jgi:hypothetical protein
MQKSYPEVHAVTAKVITDKPVKKTPYQVKGVFMRQYPDEDIVPMLDGRYREHFLYPRVQVKILNEQIYVMGIGEGVDPVLSLVKRLDFLDFGNITFQVLDVDLEDNQGRFHPTNRLIRYRFLTPWVALNQTTGSRYRFLNNAERVIFLNRLLGQNIVFLAREMGLELEERIYTKTSLTSLFPRPVDEHNWGAFTGEFRTNFILPNYLGIGNGITRGFGTIYGLFNPDMFQFDEAELKAAPPAEAEEISENDFELEAVQVQEVPPPRKRARTTKKVGSTKRVLSEEFQVEDTGKPTRRRKTKKKMEPGEVGEDDDPDARFNREEYHRRQHDI